MRITNRVHIGTLKANAELSMGALVLMHMLNGTNGDAAEIAEYAHANEIEIGKRSPRDIFRLLVTEGMVSVERRLDDPSYYRYRMTDYGKQLYKQVFGKLPTANTAHLAADAWIAISKAEGVGCISAYTLIEIAELQAEGHVVVNNFRSVVIKKLTNQKCSRTIVRMLKYRGYLKEVDYSVYLTEKAESVLSAIMPLFRK